MSQSFHLTGEHQQPLLNVSITKILNVFVAWCDRKSPQQSNEALSLPAHSTEPPFLSQVPSAPGVSSSSPTKTASKKKPEGHGHTKMIL